MQRHITASAYTKDFSHLLADYKVARRSIRKARRAIGGGVGGRGGRGGGRSFRPGDFNEEAWDGNNDGMVQDGTRWERPAGQRTVQRLAKPGAKPEKLTASFKRKRRSGEPVTENPANIAEPTNRRARRRLGKIRKGVGVPVRQPGPKKQNTREKRDTRETRRMIRAVARSIGAKTQTIGQRFFVDFSKKQRDKSLQRTVAGAPWLKSWLKKEQISDSDDQVRYVMDWMKNNALEAARRSGMLDNKDNLTEDAIKAGRWYEVAHDLANELAAEVDIPPEAIYAVLAMFSAKTAWPNNVGSALAVVRRMQENPVLDDEYAARMHQYRLGARIETAKDKLKSIPPKQRKEILKALRNKEELTDEQKKLIPPNYQALVNDIAKIAKQSPREYVEELGGVMGVRLRQQRKQAGGFMLKMAELDSFPTGMEKTTYLDGKVEDTRVRGVNFEVEADGSYAIKYSTAAGNTQHSPAKEHADAFEILKQAFDGEDMNLMMTMIDANLGEGSKIRSFYNNIADPNDEKFQSATIDTHMGAQLMGVPVGGDHPLIGPGLFGTVGTDLEELGAPEMYPLMAEVIYEIAQEWGIKAREAQSILWEAQRWLWNRTTNDDPKTGAAKEILAFIEENTIDGVAEFTPAQLMAKLWESYANMGGNLAQETNYDGPDGGLMPRSVPRVN